MYLLELFHGPTCAFKDIALQFLANLFEHFLATEADDASCSAKHLTVLGATSGDTGGAAIAALRGKRGIQVYMLHPRGRVSELQGLQMTTVLDNNIHNIRVAGTFDDCQSLVKTLFCDEDFRRTHRLGAVNSINWARILVQIVCVLVPVASTVAVMACTALHCTVPTRGLLLGVDDVFQLLLLRLRLLGDGSCEQSGHNRVQAACGCLARSRHVPRSIW